MKKIPIDLLDSEKEFYKGDPYIILNILNQIRLAFRNEYKFNKTLTNKLNISRSGFNTTMKSQFNQDTDLNVSLNNTKFNDLKNRESRMSKEKNITKESGLIPNMTCKVNGVDHSSNPFSVLNQEQRKVFIMPQKCFFK